MTTSEAIDVFKEYLTTKIVPRPIELVEASKVAIEVLTQQLEETDTHSRAMEQVNEDIITIHLGRVVSEEVYNQIVKDIIRLLERKYPSNANWYLDS